MKGLLYIDPDGEFKIKYVREELLEVTSILSDEYYKWMDVYIDDGNLEVPVEFDLIEEEFFEQKDTYAKHL